MWHTATTCLGVPGWLLKVHVLVNGTGQERCLDVELVKLEILTGHGGKQHPSVEYLLTGA